MATVKIKHNPQRLLLLVEARAKKLTQDEMGAYFGFAGPKRRETVGNWERGNSRPHTSLRPRFLAYLLDRLRLVEEPGRFQELWSGVMVGEWSWEPLAEAELRPYFPAGIPQEIEYSKELTPLPPPPIPLQKPPLPSPPPNVDDLVTRHAELGDIGRTRRESGLVVIMGMPGIGKTSLAAMLARRWPDAAKVFWHSFLPDPSFLEIFNHRLAGFLYWHGQKRLWQMLEDARRSRSHPPSPEVMLDHLSNLLPGHGYLLCLDDFHVVDEGPLAAQLGRWIAETAGPGSVSFILTTRGIPSFVDPSSAATLAGLSRNDTEKLLAMRSARPLAPDVFDRLYQRTEGNPQFLQLAISALQQGRDQVELVGTLEGIEKVETYLIREVNARLSILDRDIMVAVAILGTLVRRDAIEALLDGQNLHDELPGLRARHLLSVSGDGDAREYAEHAILQGFYQHVPTVSERTVLHARAAAYFKERSDTLRAAQHFLKADQPRAAAEQATRDIWTPINQGQAGALALLLEQFRASRLEPIAWARLAIARGRVHTFLYESEPAQASYREALSTLATAGDSAEVRKLRASACLGMGDLLQHESAEDALLWLQRGLDEQGDTNTLVRAALWIKLGTVQIALGRHADALRSVEQGLALLPEHEVEEVLADLPEGAGSLRISALINLGAIHSSRGDIAQGRRYTTQALELSERLNDRYRMLSILSNAGLEKEISGEWQAAIGDYERALAVAESLGSVSERIKLENNLGILCANRGDTDSARQHLADACLLARRLGLKSFLAAILSSLGDLSVRLEDWPAAGAYLAEAEQVAAEAGLTYPLPEIFFLRSYVLRAAGDLEAAHAGARRAVDLAHELGLELEEGKAWRALGLALLAAGQLEPALDAFERSVALLAGQDPYEAARTNALWGRVLVENGQRERGLDLLRDARATFQALGARRDLAMVDHILPAG